MAEKNENSILLYQDENGITRVSTRFADEDVWLTELQLAEIYDTTQQNINQHIKNIYKDGELPTEATHKKYLLVRTEGNRQVERNIDHYNLDMIIAIGYRVQSQVAALNKNLRVAKLQYTLTTGGQTGATFEVERTRTQALKHAAGSAVPYDLIGKIAAAATLTRKSAASILQGLTPEKRRLFSLNPEAFIQRAAEEINQQKADIVIEHIRYQPSAEEPYTQDIFNMSRSSQEYAKAFQARKAIQDYVFTDGAAAMSVERRFAERVDVAEEVVVYAKLPSGSKGFQIPTPVGNYSPDWAIAFKKGAVKHLFFIAETKGTMNSLQLKPIERAKILCARKLFNEISTADVKYHDVDNYQSLLDVMQTL